MITVTTANPTTSNKLAAERITAARILSATTLTFALLILGSVPAHAAPITISCGYGGLWAESGDEGCEFVSSEGGTETTQYHWSDYFFELTLFDVAGSGVISVTDHPMSEAEFQTKLGEAEIPDFFASSHLGSYVCIPMVAPNPGDPADAPCRDFAIGAEGDLSWDRYEFKIDWLWDSHSNGYNGSNGRARVLRDIDDDGFYDEDMCLAAGRDLGDDNYVPCVYSPFPFIISGDTDFSTVTPALATVPEPGTLVLLSSGAMALWYRKRRAVRGGDQ